MQLPQGGFDLRHERLEFLAAPLRRVAGLVAGLKQFLQRDQCFRGRTARTVFNPTVAWAGFVGAQLAFHVTPLFELALRHEWLHGLEHVVFLVTALAFWSAALAVEPIPRRLGGPARVALLFTAMPASDAAAVYLIADGHAVAGAAMVAGMMPLALAAVLVGWSWIVGEEREATLREALGGTP